MSKEDSAGQIPEVDIYLDSNRRGVSRVNVIPLNIEKNPSVPPCPACGLDREIRIADHTDPYRNHNLVIAFREIPMAYCRPCDLISVGSEVMDVMQKVSGFILNLADQNHRLPLLDELRVQFPSTSL